MRANKRYAPDTLLSNDSRNIKGFLPQIPADEGEGEAMSDLKSLPDNIKRYLALIKKHFPDSKIVMWIQPESKDGTVYL